MARAKPSKGWVYMLEHWGVIAGGLLVTGTVLAGAYGGMAYTHDTLQLIDKNTVDIWLVGERLDSKITQDNMHAIQQRKWALEERYHGKIADAPASSRDEYRRLEQEKTDLERRLQQIEQQVQQKQQTK
jgi:hypothetical protein